MVFHTIAATQEVPRHTRLHLSGSTRVPLTSRRALFPPPSSRGGILSLRGRERIPSVPVASQEEALSTGKARGTPGSCHHSQSQPDVSVHSGKPVFPALPRLSLVAAGAFDLRWGPQRPALVASGEASPHASCSGASCDSPPVNAGA